MKAVEKLKASLGANIQESMGSVLLGGAGEEVPAGPAANPLDRYQGLQRVKGAFQIPPDRLAPDPNQPRKEFAPESLEHLAQSLKERGQLQPIRVRWDATLERWVIIAGERRWRRRGGGTAHGDGRRGERAVDRRGNPRRAAHRELPAGRPQADRTGECLPDTFDQPGAVATAISRAPTHQPGHDRPQFGDC